MIPFRTATTIALAAAAMPLEASAIDAKAGGPATDCVSIVQIDRTDVRGDRVIDFHLKGGRTVRNILPQDCSQLGFERRFVYDTSLSQLCASDIITVFQESPVIRGASCALGPFQMIASPTP